MMPKSFKRGLLLGLMLVLALIAQACGAQSIATVGSKAPDFSLPDALGGQVSLDDFVGQRPVLLYFHMAVG